MYICTVYGEPSVQVWNADVACSAPLGISVVLFERELDAVIINSICKWIDKYQLVYLCIMLMPTINYLPLVFFIAGSDLPCHARPPWEVGPAP